MKKIRNYLLLGLMFTLLCGSVVFGGDNSQPPPKTSKVSENAWILPGNDVCGKWWWTRSPKNYTPLPKQLLYRFKASYSFMDKGGNTDITSHQGAVELVLRKHLFTSATRYATKTTKTVKKLSGKTIKVDSLNFMQGFRYALTDRVEAVASLLLEMNDTSRYVENRIGYVGGLLYTMIDRPNLVLQMGGFYGPTQTEYMNDEITNLRMYSDFTSVEGYESDIIYVNQRLRWTITDLVTFNEDLEVLQFLKDTEYYNWKLKLGLKFKLSKHISMVTSYAFAYDINTFTDATQSYFDQRRAAGLPSGEFENLDTTLAFAVQFTY